MCIALQQRVRDEAKRQAIRKMQAQFVGQVYGHRRALELVEDILVQKCVADAKTARTFVGTMRRLRQVESVECEKIPSWDV